jgi:hypothetical protein
VASLGGRDPTEVGIMADPGRRFFRIPFPLSGGTLVVFLLAAGGASAYSFGPPDGFAGDPAGGGLDCTWCHATYDVNSGDGAATLNGVPPAFVPGTTYDLVVILSDLGQERWGFELTVLDELNQSAGELIVTDGVHTQLSDNAEPNADYLKHTEDGTYPSTPDGPVGWSFQWRAPNVPSVTFYVAGNAANGDFTAHDDYIYTSAVTIPRDEGTPVEATSWSRVKSFYR